MLTNDDDDEVSLYL